MSRWHKPGCSTPDIVVDTTTQTPSCRACGTTPDLAALIRQQAHASPFPEPPPDQPRGEMNLWWPRFVPYLHADILPPPPHQKQPNSNSPSPSSFFPTQITTTTTPPAPAPPRASSPIYSSPLPQGHFRLAYLSPPPPNSSLTDADTPIHLTLEVYPLANCPAYETVSYCWAGEDGDDTRCRPVYVGRYWDVMLHTRNCWEMLRFVRPRRWGGGGGVGGRGVWVDAVCIDQGCDEERAAQVAQMGQIYAACTQVVVYLGPDVAPVLPEGRYPRRMRLVDVEKRGGTGVQRIEELLKRRYFSRLWVVQELILSPRVVIRIGDIDFQSDGSTSGHLWESETKSLAPWVQHTSRGAPLDLDLVQVMHLTFSTGCADPRDRLFGLMGIVSGKSSYFEPDYSLPVQAVFIGLFAHLFLTQGMHNLLALGSGLSGHPSIPSWVPDWTSGDQWRAVSESRSHNNSGVKGHDPFNSIISELRPKKTWHGAGDAVSVLLPLRYRPAGRQCHGDALVTLDPRSGAIRLEGPAPPAQPSHSRHSVFSPCEEAVFYGVDPTTGALRARLVRLMALTSVPKRKVKQEEKGPAAFEFRCRLHTFTLSSLRPLDLLVVPGEDYLYLFPHEESKTNRRAGLCILRRPTSIAGNAFQLVATCETVVFRVTTHEGSWPHWPVGRTSTQRDPEAPSWPRGPLETLNSQIIRELHWTLCEVIERAQTWLNSYLIPEEQVLFLPKHPSTPKDSLSVYWALLDTYPNSAVQAYRRYMIEHCGSEDHPDYVGFDIPSTMDPIHSIYFVNHSGPWSSFRPDRLPGKSRRMFWIRPNKKHAGGIFIPCEAAHERLFKSIGKQLLFMVRMAARRTGESEEQLLSRRVTEADCLVRVPTGYHAERLMDEYGCEGTVEDVMIM